MQRGIQKLEEQAKLAEDEAVSGNEAVWNLVVFDVSAHVSPSLMSNELDQWEKDGEGTMAWYRLLAREILTLRTG